MNTLEVVEVISNKFSVTSNPTQVPYIGKSGSFTAELLDSGIEVNNLSTQPFLPWEVFQEAICVLIRNGGRAERGNAMNYKLGEPGLSLDSIEGHIAHVVYGKSEGDSVFRRITPIACILIWSSVCKAEPGELVLISK
jgi:hypothetical protein